MCMRPRIGTKCRCDLHFGGSKVEPIRRRHILLWGRPNSSLTSHSSAVVTAELTSCWPSSVDARFPLCPADRRTAPDVTQQACLPRCDVGQRERECLSVSQHRVDCPMTDRRTVVIGTGKKGSSAADVNERHVSWHCGSTRTSETDGHLLFLPFFFACS